MTVAEELKNRGRCHYGLCGVMVAVDGEGESIGISSSEWDAEGHLVSTLADGRVFPADRLVLRAPWQVVCCEPRVPNEWNALRNKSRPPGARPPL